MRRKRGCKPKRTWKPGADSKFCTCLPGQVAKLKKLKASIDAEVEAAKAPDTALLARQRMAEVRLRSTQRMAHRLCKEDE
jgi:hypothetical protein